MRDQDDLEHKNIGEHPGEPDAKPWEPAPEDWGDEDDTDEPTTTPARRRSLLVALQIAVLILGILLVGGKLAMVYASHQQRVEAARFGSVAVVPDMTLVDFRRELGRETLADSASEPGSVINNALDFQFAGGMVVATFLGKDTNTVAPTQTGIKTITMPYFKGTVCGVHTTDPLPLALAILRSRYPGAVESSDFSSSHEVDLDGVWFLTFNPYPQGGELHAGGMILENHNWGVVVHEDP